MTSPSLLAVPSPPKRSWSFASIHEEVVKSSEVFPAQSSDPKMTAEPDPYEEEEFLLQRTARAYAGNASIHGIAYIAEKVRPVPEK